MMVASNCDRLPDFHGGFWMLMRRPFCNVFNRPIEQSHIHEGVARIVEYAHSNVLILVKTGHVESMHAIRYEFEGPTGVGIPSLG